MRWLTSFYDFSFKWTKQELEYTLLKPDYHSRWISKIQSGREDTLEERYVIRFCFKLGKTATETYGMLQTVLDNPAWIEIQFLSGIRDSRKAGSLWGMMRCVGWVGKSIHPSWLAKGLGLGLLCWDFKGAQEEIPSEEANTLQIGSVAFPPGQYTSPPLHPCHRLFDQDGHPCDFWLFPKLSLWDNWGYERGCDEGHWHAHTRGLPWDLPEIVWTVRQVNFSWRRLLRSGLEFRVYYQ